MTKTLHYDGLNRLTDYNYGGPAVVTLSCDQDVSIPNHTEQNSPNGRLVKTAAARVSRPITGMTRWAGVVSSQQSPAGQGSGYVFG